MEPREVTIGRIAPDVKGVLKPTRLPAWSRHDDRTQLSPNSPGGRDATARCRRCAMARECRRLPGTRSPRAARRDDLLTRRRSCGGRSRLPTSRRLQKSSIGAGLMAGERLSLTAPLVLLGLILVMKAAGLYDRDEPAAPTTLDEIPPALPGSDALHARDLAARRSAGRRRFERTQILASWALLFILLIVGRSWRATSPRSSRRPSAAW